MSNAFFYSPTQNISIIIIIIIIITKTMFMVLSSWQSRCESSPGSFDECRMAPSGRRPKTKPDDLGCESACTGCQKLHPPSPFIITTQPQTVTHPGTNRVWRSAATLIEAYALPLSQTAKHSTSVKPYAHVYTCEKCCMWGCCLLTMSLYSQMYYCESCSISVVFHS